MMPAAAAEADEFVNVMNHLHITGKLHIIFKTCPIIVIIFIVPFFKEYQSRRRFRRRQDLQPKVTSADNASILLTSVVHLGQVGDALERRQIS